MPFEGSSMSGNSSGIENATYDYSGFENHGTVYNATWSKTGGYDGFGAYEFDGTDNYIEIPDTPALSALSEMTISAWIKPVIIT